MGISKNEDRRKHSRVGFATKIDVCLVSGQETICLDANSRDLSLRGIFVRTDAAFSLDTQCTVDIYLTGGVEEIKLEIQGKTVRKTNDGVGIVFKSMDVETYTHLKNIVYYNGGDDSR
jgi:hypothetical protein